MSDNLPQAVRDAAARADALMAQQNGAPAPQQEPTNPAPQQEPEPAPLQQPAPAPQQPAPAPQPDNQDPATIDWEHRYRSLHGRMEAESRTARANNERMAQLEQQLEQMSRQMQGGASQQPAPDDVLSQLNLAPITEDEMQEFGPEVASFIERQAAKVIRPIAEKFQRDTAQLRASMENITTANHRTEYQVMLDRLDQEVPEWRVINTDPEFLQWLDYSDPMSGQIRKSMLQQQYKRNNADSVIAFFASFLKETGKAPAAPQQRQPEKIPLEQFAAPGRPHPAAPAPSPADKPIISRAQITAFYNAKARGEYRGREAEADAAEQMIFDAERDGRVR